MLLSHSQMYSTIAAGALNYRVREGNVCVCSAMDTGKKYYNEESLEVNSKSLKLILSYLRLIKLSYLRVTFFPYIQRLLEILEKRWLSLTAD